MDGVFFNDFVCEKIASLANFWYAVTSLMKKWPIRKWCKARTRLGKIKAFVNYLT